ncbi:EAL domain-containing protein [Shewanella gaetbuli]|uniref:EAL domain-containing protein n=1 Tax=Shewanella gaetbuli TaxID=220752 RepID=A0A9X1ZUZ6_9GAMM|nr:EAL domain-containing protein [Shewanella gaetbuli]MCL1142791.1 EAL domain-containing protein [Shewanella gaetbuli]
MGFRINRKVALLFLFMFTSSFWLVGKADNYLAHFLLNRDATILMDKLLLNINTTIDTLSSLEPVEAGFECDTDRIAELRQIVYDTNSLRWLGITEDIFIRCQSMHVERPGFFMIHHLLKDRPNFSLTISNPDLKGREELSIRRYLGQFTYSASLTELNVKSYLPINCENCYSYQINIITEPVIKYESGEFTGKEMIAETAMLANGTLNLEFIIKGNQEFLNEYLNLDMTAQLLISLFLASIFSVMLHNYSTGHASFRTNILRAIKRKQFIPYYQPIVNSETNKIIGCEILMRWNNDEGNLIPPYKFIPYAEESNLILPMTDCMLEHVFSDIKKIEHLKDKIFFSINIVPDHLFSAKFYKQMKSHIIDKKALFGNQIAMEITERKPIKELDLTRSQLEFFYDLGISSKLDDAGTGYGGFSYIEKLGISSLKIDKMFIDSIGAKDSFNVNTIDAIIAYAKASKLEIIAEGVESLEQVEYLQAKGVNIIQGYYFYKPLSSEEFIAALQSANTTTKKPVTKKRVTKKRIFSKRFKIKPIKIK